MASIGMVSSMMVTQLNLKDGAQTKTKFLCAKLQWKSITRQNYISITFYYESHTLPS